ncbi:MAG: hypothetical protein PHQ18_04545 [Patescibacteria group bacterium]|nr:hypothetical protein [Patescibacteria group bacterium]
MLETELTIEQIARKEELEKQVFQLLSNKPGMHLQELVEILDAEEFLVRVKGGLQFKFKEYTNALLKKENKTGVKNILPTKITEVDKVITPSRGGEILKGSGEGLKEKKIIPRTRYLMDVLSELGLEYRVETGKLDENMFRSRGYQIFILPEKKKLIFVNNEVGLATRVVHGFRKLEQNDDLGVNEPGIVDYLSSLDVDELDTDESVMVEKIKYSGSEEKYKDKLRGSILFVVTIENLSELYRRERDSRESKDWTFAELQKTVREFGVKTYTEYKNIYKKNGWPSTRWVIERKDFIDWYDFLGTEPKKNWGYVELREYIKTLGITSLPKYNEYRESHPEEELPTDPTMVKMEGWEDWDIFFDREEKKEWTYETIQIEAVSKGITTATEYRIYKESHPEEEWPHDGSLRKMEGWLGKGSKGWDRFLGRESKKEWTYETLQEAVRNAKISSSTHYQAEFVSRKWWATKTLLKNPKWVSWDDFLGREPKPEKISDFAELKKAVREAGLTIVDEYRKKAKEFGWISYNTLIKSPEWKGWDDFLSGE